MNCEAQWLLPSWQEETVCACPSLGGTRCLTSRPDILSDMILERSLHSRLRRMGATNAKCSAPC